jgi:DNA-binding transcriptional MocR family regulator
MDSLSGTRAEAGVPMNRTMSRTDLLACLGDWASGPGPLYARLADAIRRALERGDVPPSTRLPAERPLAVALVVSRGTVMAAYEQLRLAGLLESRQGSGTWVRLDAARPLALVNDDPGQGARARRLAGRLCEPVAGTVDLAKAATGPEHVPEAYLQPPTLQMLARLTEGHGYQPRGLPALRERICAYYGWYGLPTRRDEVLVTGGAQQAISLIAGLVVKPGDAVVVECPTYPGAVDAFTRAGARIVPIPAEASWAGTSVLREVINKNAARLVYLMPACHNPGGRVMSERRRRDIARLVDEHQIYLVEDGILADVLFDDRRLSPVAAFSSSGRVLTIGSTSKVAWGGLRVGWLRGPADLVERLGRLQASRDFGVSALPQFVVCNILDHLTEISAAQTRMLRERRDIAQAELARRLPEWTWVEPEGGLSLWIRLPFGDADDFGQVAMRHGVDFLPGSAHAVDDTLREWLRLAYAPASDLLREGIRRLADAWHQYDAARARGAAV